MHKNCKVCDFLSRFQCSRARKHATSNGLGNINSEDIMEQMKRKHPSRKTEIAPLTELEASTARKGINRDSLQTALLRLKHDTSPGFGGERNEHLTVLLFNEKKEMTARAASAFGNMCELANDVFKVNLPKYFYRVWVANRLVPANKLHSFELQDRVMAHSRPI